MFKIISICSIFQFFLACAMAPAFAQLINPDSVSEKMTNVIDGVEFEDCDYGNKCTYVPSGDIDVDELIEIVKNDVGDVRAGTFKDPHHLAGLTKIEERGGNIHFSSKSNNCEYVYKRKELKNLPCIDLIDFVLRLKDRKKKFKDVDKYEIIVVIYQYDLKKEKGFRLGFGGSYDDMISEKPAKGTLAYDQSQPLTSLFTYNLGNLTSELLSLNLNLGNLGGYLKTYRSFKPLETKASKRFGYEFDSELRIANSSVVSSTNSAQSEVGLFFSGKIIPHRDEPSRITIENGNLSYIRQSGEGAENSNSFSLTKKINLSRFGVFELDLDINRPKMLFDINTVEYFKERGAGLLFFNNKIIAKHINLIGVIQVNKKEKRSKAGQGRNKARAILGAEQLDFAETFSPGQLSLYYDPILTKVGVNPSQFSKSNVLNSVTEVKVKPYFLKLDPSQIPEQYMGQKVVIQTSADSTVQILGQSGYEFVSLKKLSTEGIYFGVEPKAGVDQINVAPLRFKLVLTLDKNKILDASDWTTNGLSNQVSYDVIHYANEASDYNLEMSLDQYDFISWR